jgi:hypothetical protein
LTAVAVESPTITLSLSPATTTISSTGAVMATMTVKASQTTTVAGVPATRHAPWYGVGSGAVFACALMITGRRRRRLVALTATIVSIAALTAIGCGGGGSSSSGSSPGTGTGGGTTTTTNATAGTYIINLSGTSGGRVHSTSLTLTVTN